MNNITIQCMIGKQTQLKKERKFHQDHLERRDKELAELERLIPVAIKEMEKHELTIK